MIVSPVRFQRRPFTRATMSKAWSQCTAFSFKVRWPATVGPKSTFDVPSVAGDGAEGVAQVALGEIQVDGLAREVPRRLGQELVDWCDVQDVLVELVREAVGAQQTVEDVVPGSVSSA